MKASEITGRGQKVQYGEFAATVKAVCEWSRNGESVMVEIHVPGGETCVPAAELQPRHEFEVGKTYWCRSACDHDAKFRITVLSRTAKTIRVDRSGKVKTLRVAVWNGVETVKPYGTYSMCPVIGADKVEG